MKQLAKPVQEVILKLKGEEPPECYLYKDGVPGCQGHDLPHIDIPLIDLGLLASSSLGSHVLEDFRSALTSWGCFMAINHGLEISFLDQMRSVIKQFFELPMEEKQRYSRVVDDLEGYGTDTIISENQVLDWTDRLYLVLTPEDRRQLVYWPENPQDFRQILHEYTEKIQPIVGVILRAMARSLSLEENAFVDKYGDNSQMHARFNFFPPCSRPDQVLGLKVHSDGSTMTIVLQDREVEGLQLLKDDQWFRVPIYPQALLINLGDQLEMMSNGVFKSPIHRVVTNSDRERTSMAVFCTLDPDKDVEPVDALATSARPRLYKTVKNYPSIYFEYYQIGIRPIEAMKL